MYIYGGKRSILDVSSDFYEYNFDRKSWRKIINESQEIVIE